MGKGTRICRTPLASQSGGLCSWEWYCFSVKFEVPDGLAGDLEEW